MARVNELPIMEIEGETQTITAPTQGSAGKDISQLTIREITPAGNAITLTGATARDPGEGRRDREPSCARDWR